MSPLLLDLRNRLQIPRPSLRCCLALVVFAICGISQADETTALAAMEDPSNPLVKLNTSSGDIFIELFIEEAPGNVNQILSLMTGQQAFLDPSTASTYHPKYYNSLQFHKVIPGFIVQTGSALHSPFGGIEDPIQDEINASALGLATEMVLLPDASVNPLLQINTHEEFVHEVLLPLYKMMNIDTAEEILSRQKEISDELYSLNLKSLYEIQGYQYHEDRSSHSVDRGSVGLANIGPNTNGAEFFVALADSPWLNGKHTVIGSVVEGLDVADRIGGIAVDPIRASRRATFIYSASQIN